MMNFNFNNPTNLYFGVGSLNELGNLSMPGKKALAKGARSMQGGLFAANPCELTDEDCAKIFRKSYR